MRDPARGGDLPRADVFHALMSDRPYRAPLHNGEVYRLLRGEAGSRFDPEMVVASSDVRKRVEKTQVECRKRQVARRLFLEPSHTAFEVIL